MNVKSIKSALLNLKNHSMEFLDNALTSKRWIFFTAILLACGTYLGNFILDAPVEYGSFLQNSLSFDTKISEGEKISAVFDVLHSANSASLASVEFYSKHFANKSWPEPEESSTILEGIEKCNTALKTLSTAIGSLRGIQLQDEVLDSYRKQYEEFLVKIRKQQEDLLSFYTALVQRDEAEVKNLIPTIREDDAELETLLPQMMFVTSGFTERAMSISKSDMLEIEIAMSQMKTFNMRTLIALLALIYISGFGVAVVITIKNMPANPHRTHARGTKRVSAND